MRVEDRSSLHECMEQQTASIAKGGIVATLNARTTILAAANPEAGQWDPYKTIVDNTRVPTPLLTRFDMIWVLRDVPGEHDGMVAKHILKRYSSPGRLRGLIDLETLIKYVAVAKHITPKMSEVATHTLLSWYLDTRSGSDHSIMTARQLEGAARLTLARARLFMRTEATDEDATRAIHLITESLRSSTGMGPDRKPDVGRLAGRDSAKSTHTTLLQDIARSPGPTTP